jgi:alpha,alpha-trehalase
VDFRLKTKNIIKNLKQIIRMISKEQQACMDYIKNRFNTPSYFPKNSGIIIGLPNKFIPPNKKIFNNDQFYWDTYFTILGALELGKINLSKGMVENLVYLYKKYNIIPSRNRLYNLGVSQPPFLTSMAFEVFEKTNDKKWLKKIMLIAEKELKGSWEKKAGAEQRLMTTHLSRYCDHNVTHSTAEQESGWDMTSRFKEVCMNYLPVDLNSCLYKYEMDLAKANAIFKNKVKEKKYSDMAKKRAKEMRQVMWSENRGFYFDYNFLINRRARFYSLAGFYPMWAELATKQEAKRMVKKLKIFEYDGGLANTQRGNLSPEYRQWDYPNGWPGQQYIVINGLKKYGYGKIGKRIAKKWVDMNTKIFSETGKMWEKYDVTTLQIGKSGRYKTQSGFGWTNGVYIKLLKKYYE